jgi:hypothetical protein
LSKKENSQPVITNLDGTPFHSAPLSRNALKSQFLLTATIGNFCLKHGTDHVLFITLTFPEPLRSTREAHRRLNSFLNKIRKRYGCYLWVMQPHHSGAIHFHLLVPVDFITHDDLEPWSNRKDYTDDQRRQAMIPTMRAESDWWETNAPGFGFGRIEVAPVYSNGEAVSKYLSRQDWRIWDWPFEEKKNVRFWGCSNSARSGTMKFSWNSRGGQACRARLKEWAEAQGYHSLEALEQGYGKQWGFHFHLHLERLRRDEFPQMQEAASATRSEQTTILRDIDARTGASGSQPKLAKAEKPMPTMSAPKIFPQRWGDNSTVPRSFVPLSAKPTHPCRPPSPYSTAKA